MIDDHQSQFFMPESPGEPEFAESDTNVTAQLGGSVFLHCPVINSGDRAVSYPSVSTLKNNKNFNRKFLLDSRHGYKSIYTLFSFCKLSMCFFNIR